MRLDESALRHLVDLLDDEDPRSLAMVRKRLLDIGAPALPFLEEARLASSAPVAERIDSVADELRYESLRREFLALSVERVPDLEVGALLLSRFEHPRTDAAVYRAWLDRVAGDVAALLPDDAQPEEAAKALCGHLFVSMGFAGNESDYYHPDNSCLSRVIDTRRGIPVTLSTVALLLARRLRIPIYGVGVPGHFLLGYRHRDEPRFVDAFRQGRLMDVREVKRMLVRNGYQFRHEYLRPVGPREILLRMMRNLLSIHQKSGAGAKAERLSALVEIVVTGREPGEDA